MRPTDKKVVATEKILCYSEFPREGPLGPPQEMWGPSVGRGARGVMQVFIVVSTGRN